MVETVWHRQHHPDRLRWISWVLVTAWTMTMTVCVVVALVIAATKAIPS
jgi:hypothetical protein